MAHVNQSQCVGCFYCEQVCPYHAIEREEKRDKAGNLIARVAKVNAGLCQGCGACVATCRSNSIDLDGFSAEQVFSQIGGLK